MRHISCSARFHLLLSAVFLPLVLSCGDEGGTGPERVGSVTIEQAAYDLPLRARTQLTVSVEGPDGGLLQGETVTYSSSAPTVAEVDSEGWVTAVGEGNATVTARASGKSATVGVTVTILDFVSISAGSDHTCGLTPAGTVWCWGRNDKKQLGLAGAVRGGFFPHRVNTTLTFQAIDAGDLQTCALTNLGKAFCWGEVGWGGAGTVTYEEWASPASVPGDRTFQSFRTSGFHMCGLDAGGRGFCWGSNVFGQLGSYAEVQREAFMPLPEDLRFQVLSPGLRHTCGITVDGPTRCWGDNQYGELGGDGLGPVSGDLSFRDLAFGLSYGSCGITVDGDAYCWGRNDAGQLGGGPSEIHTAPTLVPGGLQFKSLSTSRFHGCGVTTDDLAYCWGQNTNGNLGDGTRIDRPLPVQVSGGLNFVELTSGVYHTCGLTASGGVYCWGKNDWGQLGTESPADLVDSTTPVLIPGSR